MGFFGFGKKKEYKRGLADAAETAGEKFNQIDESLGNLGDNLHTGVHQMNENMRSILDVLETDEREKLFGISDNITISDDLDDEQKHLLVSIIYSVANEESNLTENQKRYMRAMYHYLGVSTNPQLIDVQNIYNIDSREESKIVYEVVNEFLYLGHGNWNYSDAPEYEYLFDNFNLSKKDRLRVIDEINHKVSIMGVEALVLPYESIGYAQEDHTADLTAEKIPEEFIWPDRQQRLNFVIESFKMAFKSNMHGAWQLVFGSSIDIEKFINNSDFFKDAQFIIWHPKQQNGVILHAEGIGFFNKEKDSTFIPFDGVIRLESVAEESNALVLEMFNGDLETIKIPQNPLSEIYEGLNVAYIFNLVHTQIKRGNFFLGDQNKELGKRIDDSIGEYDVMDYSTSLHAALAWRGLYEGRRSAFEFSAKLYKPIEDDEWLIIGNNLRATSEILHGIVGSVPLDRIIGINYSINTVKYGLFDKDRYYEFEYESDEKYIFATIWSTRVEDIDNPGALAESLYDSIVYIRSM